MLIIGERRDASDGCTIDVPNSAALEYIDIVPAAAAEDVADAME